MPTREVIRPTYVLPPADVSRPIHQLGSQLGGAVVVQGAGVIQTHDYVASSTGWYISPALVEFNDGTFRGALAASSIDIGGADATSWHVDADGNMWWGADGSYAAATNRISSTGLVDFTSGTFSGAVEASSIDIGGTDATSWHVDSAGNMWWGNAGSYAAATIKISSVGSVDFTSGTFSGDVEANSITVGTDAWHVDSSGNMWWGSAASYSAADIRISNAGAMEIDSWKLIPGTYFDIEGYGDTIDAGIEWTPKSTASTHYNLGHANITTNIVNRGAANEQHRIQVLSPWDSTSFSSSLLTLTGASANNTTQASARLECDGAYIELIDDEIRLDATGHVYVTENRLYFGPSSSNDYIRFNGSEMLHVINGSTRLRFDSNEFAWRENVGSTSVHAHFGKTSLNGHYDTHATFSHYDKHENINEYALLQRSDGTTVVNASNSTTSGDGIEFRIQNSTKMKVNSTGDVFIIDQPQNIASGYYTMRWATADGEISVVTSSERYKDITDEYTYDDAAALLDARAIWYSYKNDLAKEITFGMSAESVDELGPKMRPLVVFNRDGVVDGLDYDKMVVPLAVIAKHQRDQIADLEARLAALEAA